MVSELLVAIGFFATLSGINSALKARDELPAGITVISMGVSVILIGVYAA